MHRTPELLAPVGHIESFFASVENGADAVYLGLRRLSARASAVNFSLKELAQLLPYAHKRNVRIYVAFNSLLTASQLPAALDTLQALSDLAIDGLIVQDAGIFFLARRYFPQLPLHASTLMTIHNHAGVQQLERMGAHRVVLARELNLQEIEQIAAASRAELEIFVHGALCYAYSGLCLASSFRGGHSGLQGRCVQPCRLRYRQGRKEGFLLSCNDMCALALVPQLKRLRLAALKIEGRMKGAEYIAQVVRAYRHVLDAPEGGERDAVVQGQEWLAQSPSRRLTSGYFSANPVAEVLTPHRSGASGLLIGSVRGFQANWVVVALRHELRVGDRLRAESTEGKEKEAFTVSEIHSTGGANLAAAPAGQSVLITAPGGYHVEERLYKVGARGGAPQGLWQRISGEVGSDGASLRRFAGGPIPGPEWPSVKFDPHRQGEAVIVKLGTTHQLTQALQLGVHAVFLTATQANLEKVAKLKLSPEQRRLFGWALPAIIDERDIDYYRRATAWFIARGFKNWELNNWGHFDWFPQPESVHLTAGYRFNVRNTASCAALAQAGCRQSVLSLEITREELQFFSRGPWSTIPMVAVYAWPPLFTSRLVPKLQEDKPLQTPRKESYHFRRRGSLAMIYADRPVNWFEQLPVLRTYGFRHFVLDLSEGPFNLEKDMERVLAGFRRGRAERPFALFNFDRQPDSSERPDKRGRLMD